MFDVKEICPICKRLGKVGYLQLYQINFDTAVYSCPDRDCEYPKGLPWKYVRRNILDITESDLSDSSDDFDLISHKSSSKLSNAACSSDEGKSKVQLEPTTSKSGSIEELSNSTLSDKNCSEDTTTEFMKCLGIMLESDKNDIALDIGKSKIKSVTDLQNQNPVRIPKESKSNNCVNEFGKNNDILKTLSSKENVKNELDLQDNISLKNKSENVFGSLENKLHTELGINIKISNPESGSLDINNMPIILADCEEGKQLLSNAKNEKEYTVISDNVTKSLAKVSTPNLQIYADSENGKQLLSKVKNEKEYTVITDNVTKSLANVRTPNLRIYADSENGKQLLSKVKNEKECNVITENITKSKATVSTPNIEITESSVSAVSQTETICDIPKSINNPNNSIKLITLKQMPNCKILPINFNKPIKVISVSNKLVPIEKDICKNGIVIKKTPQNQNITFLKKVKVLKLDQSLQSIYTITNTATDCKQKISPQNLLVQAASKLHPENKPNIIESLSTLKRVNLINIPSIRNKNMNSQESNISPTENKTAVSSKTKDTFEKKDEQRTKSINTNDPDLNATSKVNRINNPSIKNKNMNSQESYMSPTENEKAVSTKTKDSSEKKDEQRTKSINTNDPDVNATDIGDIDLNLLLDDLDSTTENIQFSEEMDDWLKSLI